MTFSNLVTFKMNRVLLSFCCFVAILLCNFSLHAQVDTRGTDFWLTFGQNVNIINNGGYSLQIRIVGGDEATTGTIYFTNLGTKVPFSVAEKQAYTHSLTNAEKSAVYNTAQGANNLSVHITTTAPVMVYALNQADATTDATNVLPVTALGTDYYQISYTERFTTVDAYSVVAIENATKVYHNGILAATLNTGQVYYRTSTDMTGSHITTDKPVAYFMMNNGVNIPADVSAIDVLFQQCPPVNTWGKNFFIPVTHRGIERVRIVASQDATNLTVAGGALPATVPVGSQNRLTNLNAGQWVELEIKIADRGCSIAADKPVGVCSYLVGRNFPGVLDNNGDPATAWVPPVEQMIASATIAPFIPVGTTRLTDHYALVIVPTNAKAQTTMATGTGTPVALSGGSWYDNPTISYSYYILKLENNAAVAYTFANPQKLFVMGYGVGVYESYYYIAGCAFRSLDVAFYANDIHYQDLSTETICSQPTQFRAEITGDVSTSSGYLKWYINNIEELAARDQWTWSKTLADGTYNIKMEVLYNDNNLTTKTVEAEMTVATTLSITTHPSISTAEKCSDTGDFPTTLSVEATGTGLSYQWYRNTSASNIGGTLIVGATSATYTPTSNLPAGNYYYYCVITTTSVCSSTETSNVSGVHVIYELPSIPIVTPLSDIVFCVGDSVILVAVSSGAEEYQWYHNNVAVSTDTFLVVTQSGSYTLEVWSEEHCPAETISNMVEVVVHDLPIITFDTDLSTICNTPYPFEMALPLGGIYTCPLGCRDGQFFPREAGHGSHKITYTYEDQYGCVSIVDTTVHVLQIVGDPTITAVGSTTFCAGDSVILRAIDASIVDAFYFQWLYNGNAIVGATANSYTAKLSGIYTLYIESKDNCASDNASNPIEVTVYELPSIPVISPAGPISFCAGDSILLVATSERAIEYQWYRNGAPIHLAESNTYSAYQLGSYTVQVSTIEGCVPELPSNVVFVNVTPLPTTPVLTAESATDFCEGLSVDLIAQSRDAINYEWYKDNVLIEGVTGDTYTAYETGNYYIKAIGIGDCYAQSSSNEVSVVVRKNPLIPTIYPSPAPPYYYGVDYRLNISPTENGVRYKWYKDGVFIGEFGISHFLPMLKDSDSGVYYVEAVNDYCLESSPDFILAPIVMPELFIPNVFTPNGDGINDNFYILGLAAFPENELTVINKRGKLVYSKKYYDNSWDGEGQPDDIYYYYFVAVSLEGVTTTHRGYVYIKRKK